MNSFADARVGSAAAEISRHGVINVGIRWVCVHGEQRRGAHHLSRLAVTALRDLHLEPRALHGMREVGRQPLDGRDALALDRPQRSDARAEGVAVNMHSTRAAKRHAAAELRAGQA